MLLFALDSDRHDAFGTLEYLRDSLHSHLSYVVFTSDTNAVDKARLVEFESLWKGTFPDMRVVIADPTHIIDRVRELSDGRAVQVLVTGSLFLVGFVLKSLRNSP